MNGIIGTIRVASGIIGTIIYLICLLFISSLIEAEGLVASHRSPILSHLSFGTDTQANQSLASMPPTTTHDIVIQLTDITLIDQPRLSQSLLRLQITFNRLPILLGWHICFTRLEIVSRSLTVGGLLKTSTVAGAVITRRVIASTVTAKQNAVRDRRLNIGPFATLISSALSSPTKSGNQAS